MGASGADPSIIRVFSGGAPQRPLSYILPEFERATGLRVDIAYQIVSQLQERVIDGDLPDLILAPAQVISAIGEKVALLPEGSTSLARVGVGVIVAEGAECPDVSSEAAFRSALLRAKAIVLADPRTPSGKHLNAMLDRIGLADELRGRLIHKGAIHGGGELVTTGAADIGLFVVSEVKFIAGVRVAGPLPSSLQQDIVYTTAIPQAASTPENALALIRHLKGPGSAEQWADGGFQPA